MPCSCYNIYIVTNVRFSEIVALPEGLARTAAIAAWVQGLYPPGERKPVLVGGAAVELYTGGAYTTGDFDFVGSVPTAVRQKLEKAGFERQGRHWIHRQGEIFLEFPSSSLEGEESIVMRYEGYSIEILSPESILADRLAAWHFWNSEPDGVSAFLVWRSAHEEIDPDKLQILIEKKELLPAWENFQSFAERFLDRNPSNRELREWASRKES